MTNKIDSFLKHNKWFIVFYLLWFFVHFILIMNGENNKYFWPFYGISEFEDYGVFEFSVYLMLPIIFYIIWELVGQDVIHKKSLGNLDLEVENSKDKIDNKTPIIKTLEKEELIVTDIIKTEKTDNLKPLKTMKYGWILYTMFGAISYSFLGVLFFDNKPPFFYGILLFCLGFAFGIFVVYLIQIAVIKIKS